MERESQLTPPKAFAEIEEASPKSDCVYYDCEPELEFDDCELTQSVIGLAPLPPELLDLPGCSLSGSSTHGIIEENYEEELAKLPELSLEISGNSESNLFPEFNGTGLVEVLGDDEIGRRVIVVSACRFPQNKDSDKLLRYLMCILDKYVEQDYSLVYFHYGLTSKNKPPLTWLWKAYRAFDRKYKKNLKALYLIHPTNFIRIVWQMLRPVISVKFGHKMMYVNYLHELQKHLPLDKLCIPESVLEHDRQLLSENPKAAEMARQVSSMLACVREQEKIKSADTDSSLLPPTQQFGVSLHFIKENNVNMVDSIPPVVRQCIEYLSRPDALETEGIFRRSANVTEIKQLQRSCNMGEPLDFKDNPHNAAVILKTFFRDLEEPLLTFALYDEILKFQTWQNKHKPRQVKILILEKLPLDNYHILKYLFQFLWKVQDRSCLNKMTISNLAIVFGPNLIWPTSGQMTLQSIVPINGFTEFLLENQESIFII